MTFTVTHRGTTKTVESKRTATICEIADKAFGWLPSAEYGRVVINIVKTKRTRGIQSLELHR